MNKSRACSPRLAIDLQRYKSSYRREKTTLQKEGRTSTVISMERDYGLLVQNKSLASQKLIT